MWGFIKMHCYFTSCFVCGHSRLVIAESNSKIGGGGSDSGFSTQDGFIWTLIQVCFVDQQRVGPLIS